MNAPVAGTKISFRWKYVLLPLIVLLVSVGIAIYFYSSVPYVIAYHFTDGIPDQWAARELVIAFTLVPQFVLVLLAIAVIFGAVWISSRFQQIASLPVGMLLTLMGNMLALPQLILGFAMLDIFSYNSYQTRLMPVWLFALLVMVLGGIAIGIYFVLAIRQIRATPLTKEQ